MNLIRLILVFLCLPIVLNAQQITSPAEFLGYEPGQQFTFHHKIVAYVNLIANQSDRVQVQKTGTTYEGRDLLLVTISSPANLQNSEAIRLNNLKRARMEPGASNPNLPTIVWLSYNVHGNEAVSSEAALVTLYELATTTDPEKLAWLDQVVIKLDPCLNPDGRDRYVNWYRQTLGAQSNTDPNAREHQFQWATGRTNHYYFDMNRDWAWLTQKESRARVSEYQKWMPQVHVDFHEQGYNEPYYFAPAAEPMHEVITPFQKSFQVEIGKNHAKYFDENAWLFFTREVFDLFYPSYGDSWPMFNGAIGMTYEQGGINAGLQITTETGDVLSLKDRIEHHYTTSLSTIESAAKGKTALLREFESYFKKAVENPDGEFKSYVLKHTESENLEALLSFLDMQHISYETMVEGKIVAGYNYFKDDTERYKTQAGDILISTNQPKSTLLRVLFDPKPALSDSITYDITAWALPWVYGVETIASNQKLSGQKFDRLSSYKTIAGEKNAQAFIFKWDSFKDAQFLSALFKNEFRLRTTDKEIKVGGTMYHPGSILLLKADHAKRDSFLNDLDSVAASFNMKLAAVQSGFVENGVDLGSANIRYLSMPKVAILSGEGVSSSNLGELWYYFDQDLSYPVSLVDINSLSRTNLSAYDVILAPSGRYVDEISDGVTAKLKEWVRNGGTFVAFTGSSSWFGNQFGTGIKEKSSKKDTTVIKTFGNRERDFISNSSPGAIYSVKMDETHPLGFGFTQSYFALRLQDSSYELLDKGWNVGVYLSKEPISGFVGSKAKTNIQKSMVFGVDSMGSGEIVYLTENPLFRAFLYQNKLIVANAIFQVGQPR